MGRFIERNDIITFLAIFAAILVSVAVVSQCNGGTSSGDTALSDSLELVKSQLLDMKNAEAREQADRQRQYDDSLLDAHPKIREELDDFPMGLDSEVFICTGPRAKHFHTFDDCPSLNRCTDDIEEVELRQAVAKNRKRCKLCEYVEQKMEEAIDDWQYEHRNEITTD